MWKSWWCLSKVPDPPNPSSSQACDMPRAPSAVALRCIVSLLAWRCPRPPGRSQPPVTPHFGTSPHPKRGTQEPDLPCTSRPSPSFAVHLWNQTNTLLYFYIYIYYKYIYICIYIYSTSCGLFRGMCKCSSSRESTGPQGKTKPFRTCFSCGLGTWTSQPKDAPRPWACWVPVTCDLGGGELTSLPFCFSLPTLFSPSFSHRTIGFSSTKVSRRKRGNTTGALA